MLNNVYKVALPNSGRKNYQSRQTRSKNQANGCSTCCGYLLFYLLWLLMSWVKTNKITNISVCDISKVGFAQITSFLTFAFFNIFFLKFSGYALKCISNLKWGRIFDFWFLISDAVLLHLGWQNTFGPVDEELSMVDTDSEKWYHIQACRVCVVILFVTSQNFYDARFL